MSAIASVPERREPSSFYGRILTGADVEDAALNTLRENLPRFVAEVERQRGRTPGKLAKPRSYVSATEGDERRPEHQLPCVLVLCPGWPRRREVDECGRLTAVWRLEAGVMSSAGKGQARVRENMQLYTAAVRSALASDETLGGFAEGLEITGEDYGPLPSSATRSRNLGTVGLEIIVRDVTTFGAGSGSVRPVAPEDPTDPTDWAKVTDVQTPARYLTAADDYRDPAAGITLTLTKEA